MALPIISTRVLRYEVRYLAVAGYRPLRSMPRVVLPKGIWQFTVFDRILNSGFFAGLLLSLYEGVLRNSR
jgi:hypothetical protein